MCVDAFFVYPEDISQIANVQQELLTNKKTIDE